MFMLEYIIKCFCTFSRPLHIAARSGLVRVVRDLINKDSDLNARDEDGKSHPLLTSHCFEVFVCEQ